MNIKEALESEEGKAAIAAAVETATAGLKAKIDEFKSEKQKLKDEKDQADAARQQAEEEAATKSGDVDKVKQQLEAKHKKELDTLNSQLADRSSQLNDVLIEKGLTESLSKSGIAPQFLDAAKALIKSSFKPEVVTENGSTTAKIDGKTVDEFISSWSQGDSGKHFKAAPTNVGGGASGSNSGGGAATETDLSKLSPAARLTAAREAQNK